MKVSFSLGDHLTCTGKTYIYMLIIYRVIILYMFFCLTQEISTYLDIISIIM